MTVEKAKQLLITLEEDGLIKNLIAQANSKNILLETNESVGNSPEYNENLDEKINYIAFSYLSIACAFKENKLNNENDMALKAFERAGDIIYYIHAPERNKKPHSDYYLLISSLSFYIASQYSKSFIAIKKSNANTEFTELIGLFLKKDLSNLALKINGIMLNDKFQDESIVELNDSLEENFRFYSVILAKALNLVIEYIYSGNQQWLNLAKEYIDDLNKLSSIDDEPLTWWTSRLLSILLNTFEKYSFWNILPNTIPSDNTNIYIQQLAFNNPAIVELFYAQYEIIKTMRDNRNITISLPTSSGKTRIAEVAILETLTKNQKSKVLYLAPFRSLCFEIEESMNKVFSSLGFSSTFLYGSAQYSKIDKTLIEHSNIIIATPEKAKAIIRADEAIANDIKLLVIDEGHLLGLNQRFIKNEMFIEELKFHINKNNGRIILLSAVLPNAKVISRWISNDDKNNPVCESKKKLSNQRFGILKWTKNKEVNIEWIGEEKSFNNDFVERILPNFPNNKSEGIASTALKLSKLGTVLLFIAQSRLIVSNARRVLKAMGDNRQKMKWKNRNLFTSFKLTCEEAGENEIFEFAEYGIFCHHGKLSKEMRILLEKMMREETPKVIVSTSTLGQGVNIGISTVIFADVFMDYETKERIDSKDFWNIAGRAGRAFVDIEGKILYAIDETKKPWITRRNEEFCQKYFNISNIQDAKSGLLSLIKKIKSIALTCNMDFEFLLQLISENNFSSLKTDYLAYTEEIMEYLSWIDDTLLALDYKQKSYEDSDASQWIDDYFRDSLAFIQAENEKDITQEEIIRFLKARNKAVINIAGSSSNWESIVKSGIPLSSSVLIEEYLDEIKEMVQTYNQSEKNTNDTIEIVKNIESIIKKMPSSSFKHDFEEDEVGKARKEWFSGAPLSKIKKLNKRKKICLEYFAMTVPWAINAITRKLYDLNLEEEAGVFGNLALFAETGLPNIFAVKIYLSGIKSRVASLDLSKIIDKDFQEIDKRQLFELILSNKENIAQHCLQTTKKWIDILYAIQSNQSSKKTLNIKNLTPQNISQAKKSDVLTVREFSNKVYLCSPDFETRIDVTEDYLNDVDIKNNLGVCFKYSDDDKSWIMKLRNPNLITKDI